MGLTFVWNGGKCVCTEEKKGAEAKTGMSKQDNKFEQTKKWFVQSRSFQ